MLSSPFSKVITSGHSRRNLVIFTVTISSGDNCGIALLVECCPRKWKVEGSIGNRVCP